ncbi:MAG: nucleotidyltransferase family protein [Mollicutes bacterium]|mgnify:CR=1 FL=1|jgi:glucose-1-phosphate thymidylyltransferase|nr:nucleotidyltransferase family protein [Mollicutes bacterium]
MKCILLCAGYATRLFPLTENFPKALLDIEPGKPLLNYIVEEVNTLDEVDEIFVISNNCYYQLLADWASALNNPKPIRVLNDNTNSNEDRLGAIGDIMFTIEHGNINDDILVIAGDNLFDYKLRGLLDYYHQVKAPIVACKEVNNIDLLRRCGVVTIDENNCIIGMVEKPAEPPSNIVAFATYLYPKKLLPKIKQYLEEGNKPDAPGHLVEYFYKRMPVYSYLFEGNCYDVGTHEALKEVRQLYCEKKVNQ